MDEAVDFEGAPGKGEASGAGVGCNESTSGGLGAAGVVGDSSEPAESEVKGNSGSVSRDRIENMQIPVNTSVTSPTVESTVPVRKRLKLKEALVPGVSGGKRHVTLAEELDAHRKRFGLPTILAKDDVAGGTEQPHAGLSQPSFSLGLTQVLATDGVAVEPICVEGSAGCGAGFSQPSFSLGLTQEPKEKGNGSAGRRNVFAPGLVLGLAAGKAGSRGGCKGAAACEASKTNDVARGESKGAPARPGWTKSMVARLPVVLGTDVEIDTKITRRESAVWEFLFKHTNKTALMEQALREVAKMGKGVGTDLMSADIEPTEYYPYVMFEDRYGLRAEAPLLHSLAIGKRLYGAVVDAWVHVLNHDPNYRFAGSPRRLFVGSTTIVEWMLTLQEDPDSSRVAAFKSGLSGALCGDEKKLDLLSFDMVFVPVLEWEHYYIVVFDMQNEDICVIDNNSAKRSSVALTDNKDYSRKSMPYKVKHIFVEYLSLVNHPKAVAMRGSHIRRVDLPWATHTNTVDCGVFVMRHMESYMGVSVPFKCGFNLNGKRKQAQLDALRKRYAANILLSATNIYKDRIWHGALEM